MMSKPLLIILALGIGAAGIYLAAPLVRYMLIPVTGGVALPTGFLKNISSAEWLTSEPVDIDAELARGNLILIDFWTYSCINCVRSVPYTQLLFKRYAAHGLTVIGIHSPEFSFEKSPAAVKAAINRMGITYPVVNDAEHNAWNQIGNRVWPARYLIVPGRRIVHAKFGEGDYDQEHAVIRKHLERYGHEIPPYEQLAPPLVPTVRPVTPELYAGIGFMRRPLGNTERLIEGVPVEMALPRVLVADAINLQGSWLGHREYAESQRDGQIVIPYSGQSIYLVLDSSKGPQEVEVLYNDAPPSDLVRGDDTQERDGRGIMVVDSARMYLPIAHKAPYGNHILTLRVPPGIRLSAITFGAYDS